MKSLLLSIVVVCLVAACGDSDKETQADKDARARAADQAAADGTIARIPDGTEPTSIEPRPSSNMSNHPLSRYFTAYGTEPLNYVGKFWNVCDEEHSAYREENCDAAVERGIRVGASVGIRLTRADLVNPAYWEMHQSLKDLARKDEADHYASLGRSPNLTDKKLYRDAFREKVTALMANMDDR